LLPAHSERKTGLVLTWRRPFWCSKGGQPRI
jgi:hypothetical protein